MNKNENNADDSVKGYESERDIDLRDVFVAGVFAWLIPGLGHLYQRRYHKAALFFLCITTTLLAGIWMGSYWEERTLPGALAGQTERRLQLGRDIYFSWRPGDKRLYFFPQACVGSVGVVALLQAKYVSNGNDPFFHGIFAPPRIGDDQNPSQPTLNSIIEHLYSWYDIGVLFTTIAGLMNLLAFFDAVGGPVLVDSEESKKDRDEQTETADTV